MDSDSIITELERKRDLIDSAISALKGAPPEPKPPQRESEPAPEPPKRGRPPKQKIHPVSLYWKNLTENQREQITAKRLAGRKRAARARLKVMTA